MKFIVSSSTLLKQLSGISGVVTSNPVVPILENFLFEVTEGKLQITASDLQTSMITELQVESKESGNIAIPAKILIDTLKIIPPFEDIIFIALFNCDPQSHFKESNKSPVIHCEYGHNSV